MSFPGSPEWRNLALVTSLASNQTGLIYCVQFKRNFKYKRKLVRGTCRTSSLGHWVRSPSPLIRHSKITSRNELVGICTNFREMKGSKQYKTVFILPTYSLRRYPSWVILWFEFLRRSFASKDLSPTDQLEGMNVIPCVTQQKRAFRQFRSISPDF